MPVDSSAATVTYGTFMGTQATFIDVEEHHGDAANLPLYGSPTNIGNLPGGYPPCDPGDGCTLTGNSLVFSPVLFDAESINQVPPQELTDGQLTFMVESKPGQTIQNMHFHEGGAYTVAGFLASTTDDTRVEVSALGFVTVLEVDGVPLPGGPLPIDIDLKFSFGSNGPDNDNGVHRFASEGAANGVLWTGSQFMDINQALTDAGRSFQQGATKVNVNIDNILFAQSEPTGTARIDKKLFFIVTVNIPEPGTACLSLIGLAGVGLFGRRRRWA